MEKAERYNYVFDQYDGDEFIYDLKEDKRIEDLSECADILNKKEKEIERWIDQHPDEVFSSDFEIKVSQLSLAMLVKFLISKNIINEKEYSAFMTDTEEQIKAFKEMFEEE